MSQKKLISVVIPAYNESECVKHLHKGIAAIIDKIKRYNFEIIIVDNGSVDDTFDQLLKVSQKDQRFKIVKLTRNANVDGGIAAGLKHATGDAAIITYADLEDPLHLFQEFIEKWEEGYKHVYGVTRKRQGSFIRNMNAKLFYFLINKLTNDVVPKNVADFRLVDRQVYESMNLITEKNRFLRGLFSWLNYKSIGIEYDRNTVRAGGKSKASTLVVISLALRGIFVFSNFPLKIASMLGLITSLSAFIGVIYFIMQYLFLDDFPINGFGTIICIMLFLFGIMFSLIGIVDEYIALIYDEVKGRPLYIVEKTVGLS